MKYLIYIFLLISFLLGLVFFYQSDINDRKESELLEEEYPWVKKGDSFEILGVVQRGKISLKQYSKGAFCIDLNNGLKFSLAGITRNYLYKPYDIKEFLEINDSIYKPAQSDSLYIYRDGKVFYFVLNEVLNKASRK